MTRQRIDSRNITMSMSSESAMSYRQLKKKELPLLSQYAAWVCAGGLIPISVITETGRPALLRVLLSPIHQTMQELLLGRLQGTFYVVPIERILPYQTAAG